MKIPAFPAAALAAVAILTAATGNRQVTQNAKSPSAETSMNLGGKTVTIEYNAPSARGRKVEGELIPYSDIYRMGADAATTLTTDTDIMIGDLKVPKGVYTLYLQAKENGPWQLAVNKQTKQWGTVYNQDQDLGRTAMKVTTLDGAVETFKITLTPRGPGGELSVEWGHTKATVPIKAS
jgi:Protein of unknown function (DUF2911)